MAFDGDDADALGVGADDRLVIVVFAGFDQVADGVGAVGVGEGAGQDAGVSVPSWPCEGSLAPGTPRTSRSWPASGPGEGQRGPLHARQDEAPAGDVVVAQRLRPVHAGWQVWPLLRAAVACHAAVDRLPIRCSRAGPLFAAISRQSPRPASPTWPTTRPPTDSPARRLEHRAAEHFVGFHPVTARGAEGQVRGDDNGGGLGEGAVGVAQHGVVRRMMRDRHVRARPARIAYGSSPGASGT